MIVELKTRDKRLGTPEQDLPHGGDFEMATITLCVGVQVHIESKV